MRQITKGCIRGALLLSVSSNFDTPGEAANWREGGEAKVIDPRKCLLRDSVAAERNMYFIFAFEYW